MKKLLGIFILVFCLFVNVSADNSNIWLDYEDKQLSAEQVIEQCETEYNFPNGSELVLSRTVEDNIGMTHHTYQQYIDGIKVEGCYLLVHTRNGIVSTVNGRLLEVENLPLERVYMPRRQLKAKNNLLEEQELEPVIFEYQDNYYSAYKYFDPSKYAYVYIDSKNGNVIVEITLVSNANVNGTAFTMYSGWQNIIYDSNNGINTLYDNSRKIFTIDASSLSPQDINNISLNDILNTCSNYTNPTSEWYTPVLTSVTITWAAQSWWYNALTDASPDLYIKVKKNGVVLYQSGYYDDINPPVTFYIPIIIEADGDISIEVCDYDGALGSDDSAGSVKISKTTAGTYSWNNSKTQATYTISKAAHPALDVHWGMEKVYDFYREKFNFVSYDDQGSTILQLVNPPSSLPAFANYDFPNQACAYGGSGIMAYGLGDGEYYNPFVSIDIMGHEYTHMVTAANGEQNLPNYGEGGALNESFGDIMGNAIEAFALGSADWIVAKGIIVNDGNKGLRSMVNPKIYNNPNAYLCGPWQTITGNPTGGKNGNDMDGVHTNCGVQNFWFYLLCEGGTGNINDDTSKDSYSIVGIGMDKAIQIVYRNLLTYITSTSQYPDSRKGSIQAAIELYGKGSQEHKSVVNAWHAVGVGDKYIEETPEPDNYVIVAQRDAASNWFYMTSDLGSAGTKRYQAVDAGTPSLVNVNTTDLDSKYYWTIEGNKLKTAAGYSTWTSGNSATLNKTGKDLSIDKQTDGTYIFSFIDGDNNTRRLALNKDSRNNYFAYYKGQDQIYKLTLIKKGEVWRPENIEFVAEQPQATKILRNGQILILRGDHTYTLTGQEVK